MPPTLIVSPLVVGIAVGETFQLAVSPNSHGVKWSCTACHIVSVDNNGLITGLAEGTGEIIARRGNQSVTVNVTVGVVDPPPPPDPPPQPTIALAVDSGQIVTDQWVFNTTGTAAGEGDTIVESSINFSDGAPIIYTGAPPQEIPHTFSAATSFVVTLSIRTNYGYVMAIAVTVTVLAAPEEPPDPVVSPTASFSFISGQFINQPVTFSTEGTFDADGVIASHTIDYGDGTIETNAGPPVLNPTHVYLIPGTYTATLTVFDDDNAAGSDTAQATVVEQPTVNLPPIARLGQVGGALAGDTFSFSTNGSTDPDGQIVSWLFEAGTGAQQSDTGPPPSLIQQLYPTQGTFSARLTVVDNNGLSTTSTAVIVTVAPVPAPNQPPSAILNKTSGTTLGDTFIFAINGVDPEGGSVMWDLDFGDGSPHATGTDGLPTTRSRVYAVAATREVVLTTTDPTGMSTVARLSVVIAPAPPPNQPPSAGIVRTAGAVLGDTFSFALTGVDPEGSPVTWRLNFGDSSPEVTGTGLPANRSRTYTAASTYTVTLRVTDVGGLTTIATLAVTVVIPTPSGNTRFEQLRARPERIISLGFRSMADINSVVSNPSTGPSFWMIDNGLGAAKYTFPPPQGVVNAAAALYIPIHKDTGSVIVTFDARWSDDFLKVAFGGGYNNGLVPSYVHKMFQHGFGAIGVTGRGDVGLEEQVLYRRGTASTVADGSARIYGTAGTNFNNGSDPGLFGMPPNNWIRYVSEVQLNRPSNDFPEWTAGGGTLTAGGIYHKCSIWMMTPTAGPFPILYRVPKPATSPQFTTFWFEGKTSQPGGLTRTAYIWWHDFNALYNYNLPATPTNDTLIFQRPPAG